MKKIKLFIITVISILLPSCSNTPTPSQNNNLSGENQRLSNVIENSDNFSSSTENIKFPIGGDVISGETIQDEELLYPIDELDNSELQEADDTQIDIPNIDNNGQKLLATYSSKVYTKTEDRQKNLRIVCDKLTGTILKPNQEFSYNTTCGPYNKENGFGKATVFLSDGTEMQDYGGGVCQLSSTLYNAIKDLNVEITERHKHSKKVYYVPDGQDATVSYGNLDFKFKNLNNYSLLIEASSDAEKVEVNVYEV